MSKKIRTEAVDQLFEAILKLDSVEECYHFFRDLCTVTELLSMLEERLRELSRGVEELRLRAGGSGGLSIQLMTLPAVTCCTRRCEGHTIAEKYNAMYDFYGQCVRQGCRLSHEPIFTISERTDYLEGHIGDTPFPYSVCVPVHKTKAAADAVTLPACRVLSVLYCGDYSGLDEAWLTLGREVKARGLTPTGDPRILGIVAAYTGREIATSRYCSRLVLPIGPAEDEEEE